MGQGDHGFWGWVVVEAGGGVQGVEGVRQGGCARARDVGGPPPFSGEDGRNGVVGMVGHFTAPAAF